MNQQRKSAGKKKPSTEKREIVFDGYTLDIAANGHTTVRRGYVETSRQGDYGADPLSDGTYRMVPSGDVVSYEERCRRLGLVCRDS